MEFLISAALTAIWPAVAKLLPVLFAIAESVFSGSGSFDDKFASAKSQIEAALIPAGISFTEQEVNAAVHFLAAKQAVTIITPQIQVGGNMTASEPAALINKG